MKCRALAVALLWPAAQGLAQEFYELRLRAGEAELAAKQPREAAASLRIAAFGLLDRPVLLCEALAYRALAEDASGRSADATSTLVQIVQVARAFPACRNAQMQPAGRTEFASLARRRLGASDAELILAPAVEAPASGRTGTTPASAVSPAPTARAVVSSAAPPPTPAPVSPPASPPRSAMPTPRPPEGSAPSAEELDRQPQIRSTTKPVYPPAALQARIGGVVLLRVLVSATGEPTRVEVSRSVQADLDSAAVSAVRRWRFDPGQKAGMPVEAWMTVAVPFDPSR